MRGHRYIRALRRAHLRVARAVDPLAEQAPPLDASSVVSILISSEFLEMANLVEHCLKFMAAHVGEILEMPIDLACVSDALVQRRGAVPRRGFV